MFYYPPALQAYGLIEGQDFEVFDNFIKNPNGGRPLTEYALTVDVAKELSIRDIFGSAQNCAHVKWFYESSNANAKHCNAIKEKERKIKKRIV